VVLAHVTVGLTAGGDASFGVGTVLVGDRVRLGALLPCGGVLTSAGPVGATATAELLLTTTGA
jgi:hypothetical protein